MTGLRDLTAQAGAVLVVPALLALFAGSTVVVATALGAVTKASRPEERMRRRLSIYTLTGRRPGEAGGGEPNSTVLGNSAVARSAVELAERVVEQRGLEDVISHRLEAAGLPLRTAEWLLIHIASGVGAAVFLMLLSGGQVAASLLGLMIGLGIPWAVLVVRQGRRESAFLAQLPDTLQLLAGGLRAGYSLPQAIDAAARQGEPPMSSELNRALIETRLGMPTEEALERIGARMSSADFSWVVLAINIQREVGGNLAELLVTVAEPLRERERLRRQV
ncbi:MAG TPA: type II secretion system F family protein, partial [Kineosporiaceae bacterium]|nr:type II secretion system F family protein [Kineosporiaceae bacterium]